MIKNIAIILLLSICVFFYFNPKIVEKQVITKEARDLANAEAERVKNKIDAMGFEHAVHDEVENIFSTSKQLDDSSKRKLDSTLVLLGIKEKQLKEWKQYSTTLEGKLLAAVKNDSSYTYSDRYAKIEFVRPKDSIGAGHFNFKYNAEINYAEYSKRDWFLGKKRQYVDFWIADSRATINGVKRVKFQPKEDRIKLEINASSYYTDRLNLGADAGLTIDRTRVGAGYYYDIQDKKWKPVVSLKFKILDL